MRYYKLGNTDLKISKLVFGTWGIGGSVPKSPAYGPVRIEEAITLVNLAIEKGINLFDTSPAYGNGAAENILGKVSKTEDILISTKIGRRNLTDPDKWDLVSLGKSIRKSLVRLKRNYLDLVFLHSPSEFNTSVYDDVIDFLNGEVKQGNIRYFGISLKNPKDWTFFSKYDFSAVQMNFNLLDVRSIINFHDLEKKNIGVLARGPFASGYLAKDYVELASKLDHRKRWSKDLILKLESLKKKLVNEFNFKSEDLPELALKFVYSYENIVGIISTMNSAEELDFNFEVLNGNHLDLNLRNAIASYIFRND